MTAEPLGGSTYKITLDRAEAADLPHSGKPREMHSFINRTLDRLYTEQGIELPEGRLLAEAFLRSDGSFVLFISPLDIKEQPKPQRYYACDIIGIEQLRSLCAVLAPLSAQCSIYCGSNPERYRLIFTDPSQEVVRVCSEFGDYSEISQLFAAQTEEYLTVITHTGAQDITKILG